MKHDWSAAEGWHKTLAATLGGGMVCILFLIAAGAAPTRFGMDRSLAAAVGVWLAVPVWVAAAIGVLLARSARRAWTGLGATAAALAGAAAAALVL